MEKLLSVLSGGRKELMSVLNTNCYAWVSGWGWKLSKTFSLVASRRTIDIKDNLGISSMSYLKKLLIQTSFMSIIFSECTKTRNLDKKMLQVINDIFHRLFAFCHNSHFLIIPKVSAATKKRYFFKSANFDENSLTQWKIELFTSDAFRQNS